MPWSRRLRVIAGLAAVIVVLGGLVLHTSVVPRWDFEVVRWAAEQRPRWLVDVALTVTDLGHFGLLMALAVGAGLVVAVAGGWREAWRPAAALLLASTIGPAIKDWLERPRPPQELWATFAPGSGFPSGHSGQAAAMWLTLAFVLAARWPGQRQLVLGAAVLIIGAVGVSRVVLGVHSPTDVLAGWALGTACAILFAPRRR